MDVMISFLLQFCVIGVLESLLKFRSFSFFFVIMCIRGINFS